MIKSAQLTGPPQKSALQVAAASGHVSVMEVSEYRTSMVTMILMRQVLVRKGKANCVVTDDWGWNLLHEVRMKKNHGFDNEYNQDYGVNVEDGGEDRDPHAHDGDQAGAADCLGAIQLVERECRGLVNTRDHLGRLEPLSVKLYFMQVLVMLMMMMMMMLQMMMMMVPMLTRTPLLLSLLHSAGEQTIRQLLSLGEDPGARDMVSCSCVYTYM